MKRYLFALALLLVMSISSCQSAASPRAGDGPKTNVGSATTTDAGLTKDECTRLGLENRASATCESKNVCWNPNAEAGRGGGLCTKD